MKIYDKQMDFEKKYDSNSALSFHIQRHAFLLLSSTCFFPTTQLYVPKETHILFNLEPCKCSKSPK